MNAPAWYQFSNPSVFLVSGRDAQRYLNARLTNDVRSLAEGSALRAAQLSAQGKTFGFFHLYCHSAGRDQSYLLTSDGGDRAEVLAALKQFMVADRVTVVDESDHSGLIFIDAPHTDLPEPFAALDLRSKRWVHLREGVTVGITLRPFAQGIDVVSRTPEARQYVLDILKNSSLIELKYDEFGVRRARAGAASFPEEIGPQRLFLEAQQLDAVSFRKGCYIGQEVLEKVDSYGSLPRLLMRFESGMDQVKVGESLRANGTSDTLGQIVSCYRDPGLGKMFGFASMRVQHVGEGFTFETVSGDRIEVFPIKPVDAEP